MKNNTKLFGGIYTRAYEEVTQLPMRNKDNARDIAVNIYAAIIWRLNNEQNIKIALGKLYEAAYSNGLSDMDAMHAKIDKI
jgi:hypothetical protein